MPLPLVESVFVDGVRYPTIAIVGTVSAPAAAPTPGLPFVESVEDSGVRYPAFVTVSGSVTVPAGGEPLVESVEFNGARYRCVAEADTSLVADGFVSSVVMGASRFPCVVGVSGTVTPPVPNTPLTSGIVINGGRYPVTAFALGGFSLQAVQGWTGLEDCA